MTWDEQNAELKTLEEYIIDSYIAWYQSGQCRNSDLDLIYIGGNTLRYWLNTRNVQLIEAPQKE